jgi:hypothetical protein
VTTLTVLAESDRFVRQVRLWLVSCLGSVRQPARQGAKITRFLSLLALFKLDARPQDGRVRCEAGRDAHQGRLLASRSGLADQVPSQRQRAESLPLAAKMAFMSAGATGCTPGSPTPPSRISTFAPLRALRDRTSEPARAEHAVDEGVKSCPRAGCRKSAYPVR